MSTENSRNRWEFDELRSNLIDEGCKEIAHSIRKARKINTEQEVVVHALASLARQIRKRNILWKEDQRLLEAVVTLLDRGHNRLEAYLDDASSELINFQE
jgi:hypothetical protein